MYKIIAIVGARPQFIKHAALEFELSKDIVFKSIHTGQHYDRSMSEIFFDQLKINRPAYQLAVGSGGHGAQTGEMLKALEPILIKEEPNIVLVYGDTNSTLAGALAASKLKIPIAHVEAGLRSYNKEMPEEINRILTDHVSDILFCPSINAIDNLKMEGIQRGVFQTGDVMKDMIRIAFQKGLIKEFSNKEDYYFVTIHRPYNTDNSSRLKEILLSLNSLTKKVRFAVHPRTFNIIKDWGNLDNEFSNIDFLAPVSYFESLNLQFNSKAIITDSGGIQKEAYLLKRKCVTIRSETEWEETLIGGWNTLIFNDFENLNSVLDDTPNDYTPELYGDGFGAIQIRNIINEFLNNRGV